MSTGQRSRAARLAGWHYSNTLFKRLSSTALFNCSIQLLFDIGATGYMAQYWEDHRKADQEYSSPQSE
jgi:hypothetical protein